MNRNLIRVLLFLLPIIFSCKFIPFSPSKSTPTPTPTHTWNAYNTPTPTPTAVTADGLFIGAAGFSNTVTTSPVTSKTYNIKNFINNLTNSKDATALCYGISKGIDLLKTASINENFDKVFILTFTDGYDNYSATLFGNVFQHEVITHTQSLLSTTRIDGQAIKSYTIGFNGSGELRSNDLIQLSVNGSYTSATQSTLQTVFKSIANTLIATSKNLSLVTNATLISETHPKYIWIQLETTSSQTSTYYYKYSIYGKFHNTDGKTPVFEVTSKDSAVTFSTNNNKITGTIEERNGIKKAILPLENLSVTVNGNDYYIKNINVKQKYSTTDSWTQDVEDSKTEEEIANNIAIAIILDCSASLGSNFSNVKKYANEFIDTLNDAKNSLNK